MYGLRFMRQRIDTIQALRGIAILYIVLYHAGNIFNFQIFSKGSTGIAVFFVISGFTISYQYAQKKNRGISEALLFTKKRIARIYFPYLLPFAIMLLLFFITGKGPEYARDFSNIVRNIFLVQPPTQSIHPYAWFLTYIVYFYATFGILVIIFRLNAFTYSLLMILPYLLSHMLGMHVTQDTIPFTFDNFYFASGVLISVFFNRKEIRFKNQYALLALIFFLVVPFLESSEFLFLAATVLLFFIYSKSTLSLAFLNKMGDASYSIYLIHAVVLSILKNVIDDRGIFTFLIFLVGCIGAGFLYYVFIEQPIVKYAYGLLGIKSTRAPIYQVTPVE